MYWQTAEFNEDITKYNYIQLADWIERCRLVVSKQKYILEQKTHEEYLNDVFGFSEEWAEHYRQNEGVYKSEKFRKALLYIHFRKKVSFKIQYGKSTKEIETFDVSAYENMMSSIFGKKRIEEEFTKVWIGDLTRIDDIFKDDWKKPESALERDPKTGELIRQTYKEKIAEIVSNQMFCDTEIKVKAFIKGKKINAMSYEEFLDICEKADSYEVRTERRRKSVNFNQALENQGVTKGLYHHWQNEYQCEKDIQKKFFINLAFALAMPLSLTEQLLERNGYCLKPSERSFDSICEKAFRIGYSREMTIALIERLNMINAKAAIKENIEYFLIPNLTKNG